MRLIADIGGTNARFALLPENHTAPIEERVLPCADYADITSAVAEYLSALTTARPTRAAFAVATPVTGDAIKMTNHVWSFSIEETRRQLDFDQLLVFNDFTALAMALPHLAATELRQIGSGSAVENAAIALLGPGTGLGVSGLIPAGDRWTPLAGEGGHVTYSPVSTREHDICRVVGQRLGHVSAERLISGMGLVNVYHAITTLDGVAAQDYTAAQISEHGQAGDPICAETLTTFCAMLGTVAGNLVLTLGARGGVYIGGGIVPRLPDYFAGSPFRERFADKGRFSGYLSSIPSFVITARYPALTGLVHAFDAAG